MKTLGFAYILPRSNDGDVFGFLTTMAYNDGVCINNYDNSVLMAASDNGKPTIIKPQLCRVLASLYNHNQKQGECYNRSVCSK